MAEFKTEKSMTRKAPQVIEKSRSLNEDYSVFGKLERKSEKDKKRDETRRERDGKWPGWA